MAINPRSSNRIRMDRPRIINNSVRSPDDTTQPEQRVAQHKVLSKRKVRRSPSTLYSDKTIDLEEMEEIVLRMKEKGTNVYHVSCKERVEIASDELVSLWRKMLINWMFYVVACCELQQHSVAAATYFLDVAILRDLCETREEHQLAAATALQMSLKTFDVAVIKLSKLVALGRGFFTEDDVIAMEQKIITSLNWNLHPPTPYCFWRQYERLIPSGIGSPTRKILDKVTMIILEEMTLDEYYIKYCPSIQGLTAMMVALDFVPDECLPSRLRRSFVSSLFTVTKVDQDSTQLFVLTKKIYKTLKGKDKLQPIIDKTCTKTNGARLSQKVPRSGARKPLKMRPRSKSLQQEHSPRDVKDKLKISRGY